MLLVMEVVLVVVADIRDATVSLLAATVLSIISVPDMQTFSIFSLLLFAKLKVELVVL